MKFTNRWKTYGGIYTEVINTPIFQRIIKRMERPLTEKEKKIVEKMVKNPTAPFLI